MDKKTFKQKIWEESLSRSIKEHDIKVETVKLLRNVCFVILIITILIGAGLVAYNNYIPVFMYGLFAGEVLAVLTTIFFTPVIAYANIWKVAAEKNHEQLEYIKKTSKSN